MTKPLSYEQIRRLAALVVEFGYDFAALRRLVDAAWTRQNAYNYQANAIHADQLIRRNLGIKADKRKVAAATAARRATLYALFEITCDCGNDKTADEIDRFDQVPGEPHVEVLNDLNTKQPVKIHRVENDQGGNAYNDAALFVAKALSIIEAKDRYSYPPTHMRTIWEALEAMRHRALPYKRFRYLMDKQIVRERLLKIITAKFCVNNFV